MLDIGLTAPFIQRCDLDCLTPSKKIGFLKVGNHFAGQSVALLIIQAMRKWSADVIAGDAAPRRDDDLLVGMTSRFE